MSKKAVLTTALAIVLVSMSVLAPNGRSARAAAPASYPENRCISLDGSDYFSPGSSASYKSNEFTFEAWIKPKYTIQKDSDQESGISFGLLIESAGSLVNWKAGFDYTTGLLYISVIRYLDSNGYTIYGRDFWENTTWHHVALTFHVLGLDWEVMLYVNAVLEGTLSGATVPNFDTNPSITIGALQISPDFGFAGLMDEVRLWKIARSEVQIKDAWNRTLSGAELTDATLVGYWRFDEGSGSSSHDYSVQNNEAVFAAAPSNPTWADSGAPIVPEFLSSLLLLLFLVATSLAAMICRRHQDQSIVPEAMMDCPKPLPK